jgi:hypothetical protein
MSLFNFKNLTMNKNERKYKVEEIKNLIPNTL